MTTREQWVKPQPDPVQPVLHISPECPHLSDTDPRRAEAQEIADGRPCETCDGGLGESVRRSHTQSHNPREEMLSRLNRPKGSVS